MAAAVRYIERARTETKSFSLPLTYNFIFSTATVPKDGFSPVLKDRWGQTGIELSLVLNVERQPDGGDRLCWKPLKKGKRI